jgi:hypothetical protein
LTTFERDTCAAESNPLQISTSVLGCRSLAYTFQTSVRKVLADARASVKKLSEAVAAKPSAVFNKRSSDCDGHEARQ